MISAICSLYDLELAKRYDPYLAQHARNHAAIHRQISIFNRLAGYIPHAGRLLDWGCRQAVDACLVRMLRGDSVEIHGCDVDDLHYDSFYEFARLKYTRLTDPWSLPYEDCSFGAAISSGVLEHVPNDCESLKELYRILKPGGFLLITMLPNRFSYIELLNRTFDRGHHLRLYSLPEIRRMLLHAGFLPCESGYHQALPTLATFCSLPKFAAEFLILVNDVAEKIPIVHRVSTNLFVVAQKVAAFNYAGTATWKDSNGNAQAPDPRE